MRRTNSPQQARDFLPGGSSYLTDRFILDCLRSLSIVATQPGYTKPVISDDADVLQVVEGRHPMVEAVRPDPFVPNTVMLGGVSTSPYSFIPVDLISFRSERYSSEDHHWRVLCYTSKYKLLNLSDHSGPNMNGKSTCCRMVALVGDIVPVSSLSINQRSAILDCNHGSDWIVCSSRLCHVIAARLHSHPNGGNGRLSEGPINFYARAARDF